MAGLPPLEPLPARHMGGPTPYSNVVIPDRIIAGAFPASQNDAETDAILTCLLERGITTFVCLQAEVNIHVPEHAWRSGLGLRPYVRDAQRILGAAASGGALAPRVPQRRIDFLHLPIIDGSVTTDTAMSRLADDCCQRVLRGERLYIHCWGGHGRTGTLVAVMLGRLYRLPYSMALRYTQAYHDARVYPQGVRSPQTTVQRAQVKRLLLEPARPQAAAAAAPLQASALSRLAAPAAPSAAPPVGASTRGAGPLACGTGAPLRSGAAPQLRPPSPVHRISRSASSGSLRGGDAAGTPTRNAKAPHCLQGATAPAGAAASGLLSSVLQVGWLLGGSRPQRTAARAHSARGAFSSSGSAAGAGGGLAAPSAQHPPPAEVAAPPGRALQLAPQRPMGSSAPLRRGSAKSFGSSSGGASSASALLWSSRAVRL